MFRLKDCVDVGANPSDLNEYQQLSRLKSQNENTDSDVTDN